MNDNSYSYGFLSCTCLYKWLSILFGMGFCHAHFCTNDYPYSYGFSSCTSLYKWLSISLCMGFRHAHLCTNEYPFHFVWVSVIHIYVRMTIYFFLNWFSSCTFLYEWLPFLFELVFFMNISVRMTTISLWMGFRHAHFCTNDYPYSFWMGFRHIYFCTNDSHFFLKGF